MPRIAPIRWQTLERIFIKAGFSFDRQKGSHRAYRKSGIVRPVIIPTHPPEVDVFIINKNIKTAGLTREDYFKLLKECK